MPINCNTSFIDATEACNGRVLVCLQDTDGTPYFNRFDVDGGPAAGVSASTTGFTGGTTFPPYTQDYNVGSAEPAGFQCFYINYIVGSQTSDSLIIQTTDDNNAPVGDACELSFSVETQAICDNGGGGTGECLTLGTQTVVVGSTITIQPSSLNSSGAAPTTFVESANNITQVAGLSPISITGLAVGSNTLTFTFPNGDECDVTVNVTEDNTGGGDECIACDEVAFLNVSSSNLSAGDVLTFSTIYLDGPLTGTTSPIIIDQNGGVLGTPTYTGTVNGEDSWTFTIPSPCVSGTYSVQQTSASQGTGCSNCDLFNITVDCGTVIDDCPNPVIDQCAGGQVALQAGVPTTLTVSGCDCAEIDTITWSSTSPLLSFSPTTGNTTVVTASSTGAYTIAVDCCSEGVL